MDSFTLVFLLMSKSHQVVSPTGFLGAYSPREGNSGQLEEVLKP